MTLAELLAEAKRLDEAIAVHLPGAAKHDLCMERERLAMLFFPRLVRVAEAALSVREALAALDYRRTTGAHLKRALAAFDAEVAGAKDV